MFDNTVALYSADSGGGKSLSIIDTDNGTTKRRVNAGGGVFHTFTISHSESNEVKGVISDRHMIRVDTEFPSESNPALILKRSAYQVIVFPRHPEVANDAMTATVHELITWMTGIQNLGLAVMAPHLARVYSGES
jgi:hypothetical protein